MIAARVFDHATLEEMAAVVDVPVVNLLSDRAHPTQAVADFLTLRELFGALEGRRLAYVGDGNNVTASLAFAAALVGRGARRSPRRRATSSTTSPSSGSATSGAPSSSVDDPYEAVAGADAVYTDVWTSMGQEAETRRGSPRSPGFTVDDALMAAARDADAWFLHCLPAHRGEEVAASVIDGPRSRGVAAGRQPDARGTAPCSPISSDGDLMATLGKPQRQHRIARLLEEQAISSQAQLVEMLAADGVIATQATVSRDLEELGAVKVRIPGGAMAYAIPEHAKERTAPDDHLRRVMGEFVVEVAHSANLVVLRTPPGSAHVVASALDRAGLPDVLGTVAGDDTIILVCAEAAPVAPSVAGRPRHPRRTLIERSRGRIMTKRVVLAYSGGLDTSVAVKWIQEEWGAEVVALAVDVGQQADDPWDEITSPRPGRRRGRGQGGRRPRRVRRRLPRATRSTPTRCTRASTRSSPRCRAR